MYLLELLKLKFEIIVYSCFFIIEFLFFYFYFLVIMYKRFLMIFLGSFMCM